MTIKLDNKTCIWRADEPAMGSGKADLLDAIIATGSISAAGRSMNMSYRRAWMLVDTMNRCFREPLVRTAAGGQQGGGASVTEAGLAAGDLPNEAATDARTLSAPRRPAASETRRARNSIILRACATCAAAS
jgi:molybdate transport system regulatory protein